MKNGKGGWDHPRLCGEKFLNELNLNFNNGITPAYAGKSFHQTCDASAYRDHPRLCGEKNNALGDVREVSGSPPPMRGKEMIGRNLSINFGITPAYAGKSAVYCDTDSIY